MSDRHLTRDLFHAVANGDLHPRVVTELGFRHLLDRCPDCRKEFEAWQGERARMKQSADYTGVLDASLRALEDAARKMSAEERAAMRDLKRLLQNPPETRAEAVKRARRHFRGHRLVRLLLAESMRQVPKDSRNAFHLAELAREVLNHSPARPGGFDLLALSTAYMANAVRAAGNLREAEKLFDFVRFVVRREAVSDMEVLARIDDLEGSLRKDQRRLREAGELLSRAGKLFHLLGDAIAEARVLVNLGAVENQKGDPALAIRTTEAAIQKLATRPDSRLYLCARYNLSYFHLLAGSTDEAARLLETDASLYRDHPEPGFVLRHLWLQGNIAEARGALGAAVAAYRKTREGFLKVGIGYDAAMVSLDLAILYLNAGQTAEVRQLAEEMVPIFESQDVHREALAALMLFQEAARRDELTVAAAREMARYLREARNDPDYRFREVS